MSSHPPNQNGRPTGAGQASPVTRAIFRAEALKHYQENQEKVVLPPLVSPRVFAYLWFLGGVLVLVGTLIAFWPWIGATLVGLT